MIPSFLKRVDLDDRGVAWSRYIETGRQEMEELADRLFPGGADAAEPAPVVTLVDHDPDAEIKLVASALYPYVSLPETQIEDRVRAMGSRRALGVLRAYEGDRANRRHKPGRALERPTYRFDVLADYGAFRDLQRHRMLTIEWQALSPHHGYTRPETVETAGVGERFDDAMARSAALHDAMLDDFRAQAPYAVALAYKVRFSMQMNAREAMHLIELRTTPQGHPAYRIVGQEMHRLIAEQAGHTAIAEMLRFVDYSAEPELERLQSERRAEAKRTAAIDAGDAEDRSATPG